ncbi:hypothetical protein SNOG_03863 [Parastagonospora nodorum SN15]|uniref:Uncharacterized protein n=1 Tax=Phaeosphaeria nodorum (strain SN15 / ATCC MYA-4574 / FGSC 10173) TaxID=321614 RepID=Q0UWK1_PHANO|nr:hypothetical protein SNOG_03863 [Parastagonospora nodorum SN15]EAT89068.1 hypothetical protein SNOG_03863 [Parastagonospora nodorum SN15]
MYLTTPSALFALLLTFQRRNNSLPTAMKVPG